MSIKHNTLPLLAAAALACAAFAAHAQTVKVGFMSTYSGPGAAQGDQLDKGVKLYMKLHEKDLPPGVKIEIITRDDTGPNGDVAKRIAQELIVREKVQILTGFVWTPNMAAIAPLTAEAKVPFISMNAAGAKVVLASPYMARVAHTIWQSAYPLGQWAAKKYKKVYTAVSDFAPGHEAEEGFIKGFKEGGGQIVGSVRIPVANPDFVPYMQRVKDAKPDAVFGFVPAGKQATAIIKAYGELGLDKAGVKFIGTGDITTDEELQNMGDAPLGVITVHHYSAAGDRPANKAFVAAYRKEFGENLTPGFMSASAFDAMDAIFYVVREQKGKLDPDKTMELLKKWKNANSPRGMVSIDPETRDVINPVYLREVRKVGGKLANVEIETLSTGLKDPLKEADKKK
jgi:branched-chain amino acid transport system substrate-binding protein